MARERVQVQGLGDAVPGISPTIQRAGQYSVQVQRAGRNKLMDLADALSTVNPILQQYGQIRQFQQERDITAGQQFFAERPEEAVESLQAGLGKTKRELRKLADQGVIDERSNPDFLLGIRAARGKTLAKDFRRELLANPDAMNQEDPVGYIQQQIADFYQRPEIAGSTYAKQQVQPVLESISNEYIGQVTRVQQDREIAQGKADWLGSVVDEVKAWSGNRALLSDDVFKQWIDDGAGNFKGSRKYALDNLFKPVIMDMVERGNTGGAMRKLRDLENWVINKDTGAKFVTAEISSAINDLQREIINSGTYYTNLAVQAYNNKRTQASDPFNAEFQERLNNNLPITDSFFTDFSTRVRNAFDDQGLKRTDAENLIAKWREEQNKAYNRADVQVKTNTDTFAALQNGINLAIDVSNEIEDARDQGELSDEDYIKLRNDNATKTNFENEVMNLRPVRGYTDLLESEFSNVQMKGGNPYLKKETNKITRLLKTTKISIPEHTLLSLGQEARRLWSDSMERKREAIVGANPEISRSVLDMQLGREARDVYNEAQEEINTLVLERLKTGEYNIGLTRNHFNPNHAYYKYLKTIITNLGFETKEEARGFIATYKNKLGI
jgi:hypothetical protein